MPCLSFNLWQVLKYLIELYNITVFTTLRFALKAKRVTSRRVSYFMQTFDRWRFMLSLSLSLSLGLSSSLSLSLCRLAICRHNDVTEKLQCLRMRRAQRIGKRNETRWTRVRFGAKFVDYELSSILFCCHFLGRLRSLTLAER